MIAANGDQLGIKPLPEALRLARQLELDLVEVADTAHPPVCRIMDYGKFKYEAAQRAKESRKKASHITVKEMKYRPKISGGDFETKTRKVASFLEEGHKVKITIMFRGREVTHPELGRKILDEIAVRVDDFAKVEAYPRLDGRNMTMVLGPDKTKKPVKKKVEPAPQPAVVEPAPSATGSAATGSAATGSAATGSSATGSSATGSSATEPVPGE